MHLYSDPLFSVCGYRYYNGYDKYHYGVKHNYDSITATLSAPEGRARRFISVEVLFFSMW